MKAITALASTNGAPRLIANFKQTERNLLSVLMAALDIVPEFRAAFLDRCGYGAGRASAYDSFMEPNYKASLGAEIRPDGLIVCTRGSSGWSCFIEAKAGKSHIRPEQIQGYAELAKSLDIDSVVTLSNEYASDPAELPYHMGKQQRKGREIYHFCWAEIRTFLELFLEENDKLSETERKLLRHCSDFFWHDNSGISTYDSMPQDWPGFVEQASTKLGFGTQKKGLMEIVHGWQQERRDLSAKPLFETKANLELRHSAGARASADERLKYDREMLANEYVIDANYLFKSSGTIIRLLADLQSCQLSACLELQPPKGKKARACISWAASCFDAIAEDRTKISFDWKGRNNEISAPLDAFIENPEMMFDGQKDAPKSIRLIRERSDTRRFKSRKLFITDLEELVLGLARDAVLQELV